MPEHSYFTKNKMFSFIEDNYLWHVVIVLSGKAFGMKIAALFTKATWV